MSLMDDTGEVVDFIGELQESVWVFSVLAAAAEMGLLSSLDSPRDLSSLAERAGAPEALVGRMLEVLAASRLVSRSGERWVASPGLSPLLLSPVRELLPAELRSTRLQAMRFVEDAASRTPRQDRKRDAGEESIRAQGVISALSTETLLSTMYPRIPSLSAQLSSPGAEFLDVGAGAGGVALTLARHFPGLRVVALEPDESPLRVARENVAAAALGERIELRALPVEELQDSDRFEAAYVSQMYLADGALERGLRAVRVALRPGGWVLMTTASVAGAGLGPALARLRNELCGGGARLPEDLTRLLNECGYEAVKVFDGEGTIHPVVGRRPNV
jgi:SAM-dependent methyltransferase